VTVGRSQYSKPGHIISIKNEGKERHILTDSLPNGIKRDVKDYSGDTYLSFTNSTITTIERNVIDHPNFKKQQSQYSMELLARTLKNHVELRADGKSSMMIESRAGKWFQRKNDRLDNTFSDILGKGRVVGTYFDRQTPKSRDVEMQLEQTEHTLRALQDPVIVDMGGGSVKIFAKGEKWHVNEKYDANKTFKAFIDKGVSVFAENTDDFEKTLEDMVKRVALNVLTVDRRAKAEQSESQRILDDTEHIVIGQTGNVRNDYIDYLDGQANAAPYYQPIYYQPTYCTRTCCPNITTCYPTCYRTYKHIGR